LLEEAFDSVGNFLCGAAIADGARDTGVGTDSTTDAEVVGVDHLAVHPGFLAFEADVGGPMLAAAIGAAGDVQLQLLLIIREAIFELISEPTGEGFRFGEGEFTEFRTGASDCAADESGGQDREAARVKGSDYFGSVFAGNVDDEKILHGSSADVAIRVLIGEIGGEAKLLRGDAAAENVGAYREAVGLLLRDDAEMVAVKIGRQDFGFGGIEGEAEALLNGGEECVGGPAVLEEEELKPRFVARNTKDVGVAKDFGDGADDRGYLVVLDEGIEAHGDVRLGGESTADTKGEANFFPAIAHATGDGQADVVDLGIGTPVGTSANGDFVFARKIIKLGIATEFLVEGEDKRANVEQLAGVESSERAASDVAGNVAAGADGAKADRTEPLEDFGKRFDFDPVELNVLANGDIGDAVAVLRGKIGDGANLFGGK